MKIYANKITLLLLLLVFTGQFLAGQSKLISKADQRFQVFDYTNAVKYYRRAAIKGESVYYASVQAAACYRAIQMPEQAVEWLAKALQFPGADSKLHLLMGQELKKLNRIAESKEHINEYYSSIYRSRNNSEFNYESFIRQIDRDSLGAVVELADFNSPQSEFGPVMVGSTLLFSSNKPLRGFAKVQDSQTQRSFYSLYKTVISGDGKTSDEITAINKKSQMINYGSACYDDNSGILYLTQNRTSSQKNKSTLTINTYISDKNISLNKFFGQVSFSNNQYSVAHPTISSDGKYLYFASDMPDGYGGWDIYRCEVHRGFFSKPVNLGPIVNTPGNESFPFVASDGNLFFSSDGHPGKGGLDMFVAISHNNEFISVINLGKPINSESDDFAMVLDNQRKWGFFSSNRPGGVGEDDIYRVEFKRLPDYIIVEGVVSSEAEGNGEAGVMISVIDKDGNTVTEAVTGDNGKYCLALKSSDSYEINYTKRLAGTKKTFLAQPDLIGQKALEINIQF
jgi:tetratricopeptide (TPR) repeat protein